MVDTSLGDLNFHDALIALAAREADIRWVASFDGDFDRIAWLTRLADADGVVETLGADKGARRS